MLDDISMPSTKACVVPKRASTHLTAVGASFSLTRTFSGREQSWSYSDRAVSSRCPCSKELPLLWSQSASHRQPSLASPPDILPSRWLRESGVSSCEARGPGQPLSAVVTEWEHAMLSLLAPLLGAQSMCYSNKHENSDHTLSYLEICNENT